MSGLWAAVLKRITPVVLVIMDVEETVVTVTNPTKKKRLNEVERLALDLKGWKQK